MELVLFWLVCAVAALFIAQSKGRSGGGWFILGLIFGPLALLGAAMISPDPEKTRRRAERAGLQSGKMKRCPACAEVIRSTAAKCPHCSEPILPATA